MLVSISEDQECDATEDAITYEAGLIKFLTQRYNRVKDIQEYRSSFKKNQLLKSFKLSELYMV